MHPHETATCEIPLTRGLVALIDSDDLALVTQFTWYAARGKKTFYARTGKTRNHGAFAMHQLILGEYVKQIDHKNGNGLDNRRSNLRSWTATQNLANTTPHAGSQSRFKGVGWSKIGKKWRAYIQCNRQQHHLGYFDSEESAARAYDRAATRLFGEFARLNFPTESETAVVATV